MSLESLYKLTLGHEKILHTICILHRVCMHRVLNNDLEFFCELVKEQHREIQ